MSTLETVLMNPAGMMVRTAEPTVQVTEEEVEEQIEESAPKTVQSKAAPYDTYPVQIVSEAAQQRHVRIMTLAALAICAAALWVLAGKSAQVARLTQSVSLLQSQVTATQRANELLYNEVYQLTSVPHIFRVAKQFRMKPATTINVPLKP